MRAAGREFLIKSLDIDDLSAVASVHLGAFPDRALTLLGAEAVRRYYKWQLQGPHEIAALGAFLDGGLVGFCLGGVFREALPGFLRKNQWFLLWCVLTHPCLLMHRVLREKLVLGISILRRFGRPGKALAQQKGHLKESFGILSIAVHPQFQGMGVGRLLVKEAEKIAAEQGFSEIRLSVHRENERAVCFYKRLGWEEVLINDVWDGYMIKRLITYK